MNVPSRIFMNAALLALLVAGSPDVADAQWSTTYESFYLEARHNWTFRERYQAADRLFNAFDYGHAILYETLWSEPNAPTSELEQKRYDFLTKKVLVKPPHVPLEEAAIEVAYARLAPEAKAMFDWAHVLHRQIYDVLSDERMSEPAKDAEVARLIAYYKTRRDLAFSSKPKSMELMQEQPYSLAFRKNYPKFNGLIWGYHWLQIGLYEPLLAGRTPEARQSLVRATVARFWQMLERPVEWMPHQMPMTAAVAPLFGKRYPEAAIIFDNLHSMHDVISDILANPSVPRDRKRAEIMLAARRYRDDTSFVMTEEAWRVMSQHMGVENMGGPSVGFLTAFPKPTVTYGAVMLHDERTGAMTGFAYGSAAGGEHAGHTAAAAAPADTAIGTDHAAMGHGAAAGSMMPDSLMSAMHRRLISDPVIMRRMMADTALHRMMMEMMGAMPDSDRVRMDSVMRSMEGASAVSPRVLTSPPTPRPATAAPSSRRAPPTVKKPVTKPPPDPHAGHTPPKP